MLRDIQMGRRAKGHTWTEWRRWVEVPGVTEEPRSTFWTVRTVDFPSLPLLSFLHLVNYENFLFLSLLFRSENNKKLFYLF